MLHNLINNIIYRSSYRRCTGKKRFFSLEIATLHSCQLGISLKPLVATCDFSNLFSKNVTLQYATMETSEILRWCLSRISTKNFETPIFQNTFGRLLSLQGKSNSEGELKCLLHTTLFSNAFFNEAKDIKETIL